MRLLSSSRYRPSSRPSNRGHHRHLSAGFSIIELMIAVAVGLLIAAGLTTIFINNSRSRDFTDRSQQQIENGRYAMQALNTDLSLAGYLAAFDLSNAALTPPSSLPNPCATDTASLNTAVMLHIQGYDNAASLSCLSDVRTNTDILVIRRLRTCVDGSTGCATVTGAPYFQASLCNNSTELGSASSTDHFRLSTTSASLDRHNRDCTTLADKRQYLTYIYFVANNDVAGDGIPTLKRAELGAGQFSIVPVAEGVENLQLEYGIDTDNDGMPNVFNANPTAYNACTGVTCVNNWINTMAVKVRLLVRDPSASSGHSDTKVYNLGLNADGTQNTKGPFSDRYRRHVYQAETRLNNPAGRRE